MCPSGGEKPDGKDELNMTNEELNRRRNEILDKHLGWQEREKEIDALMSEAHRDIAVGDGVTLRYYSDAEAYTVIKRTASTITVQRDKATLDPNFKPEWDVGGFAGHCTNQNEQTYSYERNENGAIKTLRYSKKHGRFMFLEKAILLGRHEFYDYNF